MISYIRKTCFQVAYEPCQKVGTCVHTAAPLLTLLGASGRISCEPKLQPTFLIFAQLCQHCTALGLQQDSAQQSRTLKKQGLCLPSLFPREPTLPPVDSLSSLWVALNHPLAICCAAGIRHHAYHFTVNSIHPISLYSCWDIYPFPSILPSLLLPTVACKS